MILFLILISLYWIGTNAVWGRVDGGGIAKVNEWVERTLVMFGFVLACAPFAEYWSLLAFAGVLGIATGHGQYFLNRAVKAVEPEKVDFLVKFVFGQDPRTSDKYKSLRDDDWFYAQQSDKSAIYEDMQAYGMDKLYWRNVLGMFCTGTFVGIPAFVIAMVFGQVSGALFLLTGVVKSAAYMMGYALFKNTESAEFINGGGRGVIQLAVILWLLL